MTSGLVWSGLVWSAAEKIEGGKGQRDGEQEGDKSTRAEKYVSFSVFLKKQRSAGKATGEDRRDGGFVAML